MWGFMIICYTFMLFNAVNLFITGLSGYFQFNIFGADHTRFALFTILIFIITETIVMYFFISTGKGIKEALGKELGETILWDQEKKLKRKLFPQLMLTIFLVCTVFILGGAVDTQTSFAWLHGPLFLLAFFHHLWTLLVKNNSFKEQIAIISELEPETD